MWTCNSFLSKSKNKLISFKIIKFNSMKLERENKQKNLIIYKKKKKIIDIKTSF